MVMRTIVGKMSTEIGYHQDAALLKRYTGVELSREMFEQYGSRFTLRGEFGSDREIHREYYGLGIPMQLSGVDVRNALLRKLASEGVVFDLNDPNHSGLLSVLERGISDCLVLDRWPTVPEPYRSSEVLLESARKIRSQIGLQVKGSPL